MSKREALQRTPEDIVNIVTVLANTKMELPLARWNDIANILLGVSQDIEALIARAETAERRVAELEAEVNAVVKRAEVAEFANQSYPEAMSALAAEIARGRARLAAYESAAVREMRTTAEERERWRDLRYIIENFGDSIVPSLIDDIDTLTARLAAETVAKDGAYSERNKLVALLASLYPSGIKRTDIPGWEPEWHGCVFIDLPTGQASWHYHDREAHLFADLPPYQDEWDGHSTEEKYARLAALAADKKESGR